MSGRSSKKETPVKGSALEGGNVIFDFSKLTPLSYTDCGGDTKFFVSLLDRLKVYSSLSWEGVRLTHRHGFGSELMDINSRNFSPQVVNIAPKGGAKFIILRSSGDNRVMCGLRAGNAFQVYFIEYRHGDISRHGGK